MSTSAGDFIKLETKPYIMDGGLETTLIFEHGYDLPEFAAFPLLDLKEGRDILRDYYLRYIHVARKNGYGFILEGPTYRASSSWGQKLGYGPAELKRINKEAISFLTDLKNGFADQNSPMLVSGCIGPQGDGYQIDHKMTEEDAETYHQEQIANFKQAGADLVSAYTINYTEEAIGIVRAAQKQAIAAVISFTVETDGRLPSGQLRISLSENAEEEQNGSPVTGGRRKPPAASSDVCCAALFSIWSRGCGFFDFMTKVPYWSTA